MSTPITFRRGAPADAPASGKICFDAFTTINNKHNFPPDFPSAEVTGGMMDWLLSRDDVYSVVAERGGQIVGSNFLWEDSAVAGVGPITVDPSAQNASIGRRMMEIVLERARERRFAGVRLVQAAFHNRSLSLYTKLGFDVKEPLACMQGAAIGKSIPGYSVRPASREDIDACNALCRRVYGFERSAELSGAVQKGSARVVEHDGGVTGYASDIGFFGHAVGTTNTDLKALIAAAETFTGPGMLIPTRNSDLFRWCLGNGLRVVQPMTLMAMGLYSEPAGAFVPSILF